MNEAYFASARRYLGLLVGHNTVAPRPTRPLATLIATELLDYGINVQMVPSATNPDHHAGLIATWGPKTDGGIALSGHIDVVSVDGQNWLSDPFTLTEREGRLFGRGAVDMKAFLALSMAALTTRAREARNATRPVQLYVSYDEETDFDSVRELMAATGVQSPTPRLAIIGEPTELQMVTAHKGAIDISYDIEGHSCHSANPALGISALRIAHALQSFAHSLDATLRATPDSSCEGFTPPYSTLEPTILNCGASPNIVPDKARLTLFGRPVGTQDMERMKSESAAVVARLVDEYANPAIGKRPHITTHVLEFPPLDEQQNNVAVAFAEAALEATSRTKASYATEASLFQRRGIPAVVCGPGSIAQAHTANEFISVEQFVKGGVFINRMIDNALRLG